MTSSLPIVRVIRTYDRTWLGADLIAAVTVWAIVVPEAMAYASIAGMPPETGLYAAMIPLLLYAMFASSRRATVGPSAAVAALSFATVVAFAPPGSDEFVTISILLTLIVGVILILGGIAKAGVIADFLSEPVLKGFIVGVAMTIALGQLGKVFGVEVEGEGFFAEAIDLIRHLPDTHVRTLLVGLACLAALYGIERWLPRIPGAIVVVAGAIIAVNALGLEEKGVHVAGEIPAGLPSFAIPDLGVSALATLIPAAIGIAIVVYGESMALTKTFGSKHQERVDADQEMVALGTANAAGGLFGSFVTTASNSRTAAADGAGQKTQVSSLMVVVLVGLTLLFLTGLFADLPEAALGAIVIHAVIGLIKFRPISSLWDRNRVDFWAAAATLLGVLALDVLAGLMIGVLVSLAGLMRRAVRPRITWLAYDEPTGRFVDRGDASGDGGGDVSIVRFGAELFFANVGTLRDAVLQEVEDRSPSAIVFDAEAVTDIDTTAEDELRKLLDELEGGHVAYALARLQPGLRTGLELAGIDLSDRDFNRLTEAVEYLDGRR